MKKVNPELKQHHDNLRHATEKYASEVQKALQHSVGKGWVTPAKATDFEMQGAQSIAQLEKNMQDVEADNMVD